MNVNDLSAYVDRRLSPGERAAVESHLADCADCRADAMAALRQRRPFHRIHAAPVLAAALVALLIVPWAWRKSRAPDVVRSGANPETLTLVSPDSTAPVPLDAVVLTWRAAGAGVSYRVTVTTEAGDRVFGTSTPDTMVGVDASTLRAGGRYLWFVDALRPDGSALSAPARGLWVAP